MILPCLKVQAQNLKSPWIKPKDNELEQWKKECSDYKNFLGGERDFTIGVACGKKEGNATTTTFETFFKNCPDETESEAAVDTTDDTGDGPDLHSKKFKKCSTLLDDCYVEYYHNLHYLLDHDISFKKLKEDGEKEIKPYELKVYVDLRQRVGKEGKEWNPLYTCTPFPLPLVIGGSLAGAALLVAIGFLTFCIYQTHMNKLEIEKMEKEIEANEAKIRENDRILEEYNKQYLNKFDNPLYEAEQGQEEPIGLPNPNYDNPNSMEMQAMPPPL